MTDAFSVLSIGSILTSHTLIFRKYTIQKEINFAVELPKYNGLKIRDLHTSLHFFVWNEKLGLQDSCQSNSLKFHLIKQKNYKSPK